MCLCKEKKKIHKKIYQKLNFKFKLYMYKYMKIKKKNWESTKA